MGGVLGNMMKHSDRKLIKIIDALRSNNRIKKDLQDLMAKKMIKSFKSKLKDALSKLSDLSTTHNKNQQRIQKILQNANDNYKKLALDAIKKLKENNSNK